MIQNLPLRQISREQREFLTYPIDQLLQTGDSFTRKCPIVINQTQAGLTVQWDHPKPETFAAEMIRRQPDRKMTRRRSISLQANFRGREVGQLLDIYESLNPQKRSSMTNWILSVQLLAICQKFATSRSVHDPIGRDGDTSLEADRVRPVCTE